MPVNFFLHIHTPCSAAAGSIPFTRQLSSVFIRGYCLLKAYHINAEKAKQSLPGLCIRLCIGSCISIYCL